MTILFICYRIAVQLICNPEPDVVDILRTLRTCKLHACIIVVYWIWFFFVILFWFVCVLLSKNSKTNFSFYFPPFSIFHMYSTHYYCHQKSKRMTQLPKLRQHVVRQDLGTWGRDASSAHWLQQFRLVRKLVAILVEAHRGDPGVVSVGPSHQSQGWGICEGQ